MKMRLCPVVAAAATITFGLSGIASAADIHVPADFATIQAAIDAPTTLDGDVILVAPGVYTGTINFNAKSLELRSTGGANVTTLNALNQGSVVTVEMGQDDSTVIDGFTITGGTGTTFGVRTGGGGIVAFTSSPTISNCLIIGNSAMDGGGIYCFVANPKIINCAILVNFANGFQGKGGGIYCETSSPIITNATITNNQSMNGGFGGGIYTLTGSPRLINTIAYDNTPTSLSGPAFPGPIATYSNISGGFPGPGNINADPMFSAAESGDVSLAEGSPCVDRGDSQAIATDYFTDLAGNPRGVDDPAALERGIAVFGITVDMGAYEFQVASQCEPNPCPQDLDDSGDIGFGDILDLIGNWGPCPN